MSMSKEKIMKRLLIAIVGLVLFCACAGTAPAQNARGAAELKLHGKAVSVEYGRPALKGRKVEDMLGQLPAGEVWRLGANKSTTFKTATDLVFGEVTVPKGEYSLWARKEADNNWKLVFNKQHGQWGTDHDASQDLPGIPLKETKPATPAEQVTIGLTKTGDGGEITIGWGDMELSTDFKAK
ncbi:MAG: hypothetical protein DMG25_05255 [Acidobacteria bacterium]|nr:MAG: hypothetical protein DMG25_05255 [Acidobacteriota bacterium]